MNPFVKTELDYTELLLSPIVGISDSFMRSYYNMTTSTIRLFTYILTKISSTQKDYVYFRVEDVMDKMNIKSKDSVYTAIKELESIKLLVKKSTNEYWINPFYVNFTNQEYHKLSLKNIVRDVYPNLFLKVYTNESKLQKQPV